MTVIWVFALSLAGASGMLLLKTWELQTGAKPFSALRYRADVLFRRRVGVLRGYVRYANRRTLRLFLWFLLEKFARVVRSGLQRLRQFEWFNRFFEMVRGKDIPPISPGSKPSSYLHTVAEYKNGTSANSPERP